MEGHIRGMDNGQNLAQRWGCEKPEVGSSWVSVEGASHGDREGASKEAWPALSTTP